MKRLPINERIMLAMNLRAGWKRAKKYWKRFDGFVWRP